MGPDHRLDHIGIAVRDLEESLSFFRDQLGLEDAGREEVKEQKVKVAFLPTGESKLELLEPVSEDSPVAKFIQSQGQGVHHVALKVTNLEEKLAALKEKGVRLIDEKPRVGAGGALIAFIHPKSTGGILLELCERSS